MITTNVTAEVCAVEIMNTAPILMRFIRSCVSRYGGSPATVQQVRALAYIDQNPGASLSGVAEHLAISSATASAIVHRLVKHNHVERIEHPQERRFVMLNLTESGKAHLKEINDFAVSELSKILSLLSTTKLNDIQKGMSSIKETFHDSNPRVNA